MVLPNFEENLQKYARLLISKGINVQDGHTVIINIDVDQAPLARLLTKEAYALGAEEVIVKWADDIVAREKYLHTPEERLTDIPQYRIDESEDMIERKASRLSVRSADPDALNGVDSSKLAAVMKANSKALMAQRIATQANKVSWTVAAASGVTAPFNIFSISFSTYSNVIFFAQISREILFIFSKSVLKLRCFSSYSFFKPFHNLL